MLDTPNLSDDCARTRELRDLAARRTSAWFGFVFAGLSATLGLFAIFVLVAGIRASRSLPTVPRPRIGPGFSEAATQAFGSVIVSSLVGGVAAIAFAIALLHSKGYRARMLLVGLPLCAYMVVLLAVLRWGSSWL